MQARSLNACDVVYGHRVRGRERDITPSPTTDYGLYQASTLYTVSFVRQRVVFPEYYNYIIAFSSEAVMATTLSLVEKGLFPHPKSKAALIDHGIFYSQKQAQQASFSLYDFPNLDWGGGKGADFVEPSPPLYGSSSPPFFSYI
jgi:hypothetical protein